MVPKSLLMVTGELMNLGVINSFNFIKILLEIINEAEKTLSTSIDYYLYLGISVLPYVVARHFVAKLLRICFQRLKD